MAISKIILNGVTQMDLTNDTTDASKTLASYTGHGADGESFTGNYVPQTGPDIPIFMDDGNQNISCNKTFAECFALIDSGKTAAMLTDGDTLELSLCANIFTSSQIYYTLSDSDGKPSGDFIYYSSGMISYTTPSHAGPVLATKSITANGTYSASSDSADGYSSVTVNVSGSTGKNVQVAHGTKRIASQTYIDVGYEITVAKTGTYNVYWAGWREYTSGTHGAQLYVNGNSRGNAITTFDGTMKNVQDGSLTSVSLTQGDKVTLRARSRSASYSFYIFFLSIEEV